MTSPAGDNVEAILAELEGRIKHQIGMAEAAKSSALEANRSIGDVLREAKRILDKGKFGPWTLEKFGFGKTWRADLIYLSEHWGDYPAAFEWARETGHRLADKERHTANVVAIIKAFHKDQSPAEPSSTGHSSAAQVAEIVRKLKAANEKVQALKERLKEARATEKLTADPLDISDQSKERARTTAAFWAENKTPDERAAAEKKLRGMAKRHRMPLKSFIETCGVESPVDWTDTDAA